MKVLAISFPNDDIEVSKCKSKDTLFIEIEDSENMGSLFYDIRKQFAFGITLEWFNMLKNTRDLMSEITQSSPIEDIEDLEDRIDNLFFQKEYEAQMDQLALMQSDTDYDLIHPSLVPSIGNLMRRRIEEHYDQD